MNISSPLVSRSITPLIGHWPSNRLPIPVSTRTQDVFTPATGAATGHVALGNAAEVDAAVAAGVAAFPTWSATPPPAK